MTSKSKNRNVVGVQPRRVAVIGASLGGLSAANALVQLGHTVHVYERAKGPMHNKGYGMGFVDVNLWENLTGRRMIRRGQRAHRGQGAFYYGDLWKFLYEGLPKGTVRFGSTVNSLGSSKTEAMRQPTIGKEKYDLAVLADGGWSALRRYITDKNPQYSGYVIWGGVVDADKVPDFRAFGIRKNDIYDLIAMPLAKDKGKDGIISGIFVATPEKDVEKSAPGTARHVDAEHESKLNVAKTAPAWFLRFVEAKFGRVANGEILRLFKALASNNALTGRPMYEFGADAVSAGRIIMIGDAAHMASPRTAVGAHTAVQDAVALREAFAYHKNLDVAIASYSRGGLRRAQDLNARSVQVGRQFLPRGGKSKVQSMAKMFSQSTCVEGATS